MFLECLNTLNSNVILCGDFNIDMGGGTSNVDAFNDLINSYGFTLCIKNPTRYCQTKASTLDNILINFSKERFTSHVLHIKISDHLPQYIGLDIKQNSSTISRVYIRKINEEGLLALKHELSSLNWVSVYSSDNVDSIYNKFLNEFISCYNQCFPKLLAKSKKIEHKHWITKGIKISSLKKQELYYQTLFEPLNIQLNEYYKQYATTLKAVVKKAKALDLAEKYSKCKNNSKETWKFINSLLNKTPSNGIVRLNSNTDAVEIVNEIGRHFKSVSDKYVQKHSSLNKTSHINYLINPAVSSFFMSPTNEQEIKNITKNLKIQKSIGV